GKLKPKALTRFSMMPVLNGGKADVLCAFTRAEKVLTLGRGTSRRPIAILKVVRDRMSKPILPAPKQSSLVRLPVQLQTRGRKQMADPLTTLTSLPMPLIRDNIDTDKVIPSRKTK